MLDERAIKVVCFESPRRSVLGRGCGHVRLEDPSGEKGLGRCSEGRSEG